MLTRGTGYHREWWLDTLAAFKKRYPDIQINETFIGAPATNEKFIQMCAAGVPPDVVQMGDVTPFAAKGLLDPLDPLMKADQAGPQKASFFPQFVALASYKGQLFAFDPNPNGARTPAQGINAGMFDRAGVPHPDGTWRWEVEGLTAGKKITKDANGDGKPEQFFYDASNIEVMHRAWWIWDSGGEILVEKDGKAVLGCTDAAVLRGLQFAVDLRTKYHIAPHGDDISKALGGEHPWIAFYSKPNRIAMIEGWRSLMPIYKSDFDFKLVPLLTYNDKRFTNANLRSPFGIPRGAKNKKAAWVFLKWLVGPEAQKLVAKWGQGQPSTRDKSVWEAVKGYTEPADAKALDEIDAKFVAEVRPWPNHPAWPDVAPLYSNAVLKALAGRTTVATAFKGIEKEANAILARYKFRY